MCQYLYDIHLLHHISYILARVSQLLRKTKDVYKMYTSVERRID